jgi:hypothetical protein
MMDVIKPITGVRSHLFDQGDSAKTDAATEKEVRGLITTLTGDGTALATWLREDQDGAQ